MRLHHRSTHTPTNSVPYTLALTVPSTRHRSTHTRTNSVPYILALTVPSTRTAAFTGCSAFAIDRLRPPSLAVGRL